MAVNGTAIVLNRVQSLLRTNTDEYATPEELATNFIVASEALLNILSGAIHQYVPGRPVPATASQITSDIRMMIDMFRRQIGFTYNPQTDLASPDLSILDAAGYEVVKWEAWFRNGVQITEIPVGQERDYLNSEIVNPTNEFPIGRSAGEMNMRIYPQLDANTPLTAQILIGDKEMKVGFINGNKGKIDPDPAITTPTLWGKRAYDSLVWMILSYFGVTTNQPSLVQIANQMSQSSR